MGETIYFQQKFSTLKYFIFIANIESKLVKIITCQRAYDGITEQQYVIGERREKYEVCECH